MRQPDLSALSNEELRAKALRCAGYASTYIMYRSCCNEARRRNIRIDEPTPEYVAPETVDWGDDWDVF